MIRFEQVAVTYPEASAPTLQDVTFTVPEGELCLVVGTTGAGKSTLLGCINGLVPHFSGGRLSGRVSVDGLDTATHPPRELADVVGVVGQDPLAGFVTDVVEDELAYGMEQLGVPPAVMRTRVEETLDLLGIADLRRRPLRELSGGQQQRVAIGSVLTAHPRVLVLDEPTSALDPTAAEEVLAAVTRLVHDLGVTVVVAEHRLERVAQFADLVAVVEEGRVRVGPPAATLADSPVAPPIVELARLAGWDPPPLSVRDGRRLAQPLRDRLEPRLPRPPSAPPADRRPQPTPLPPVLDARGVGVTYGPTVAVHDVDLTLRCGEVVALMGRNGSGKSSLMWALQGSGPRSHGRVLLRDPARGPDAAPVDPSTLKPAEARGWVGLVPQTPTDLLYLTTVRDECAQADRDAHAPAGTCHDLLETLSVGIDRDAHPRDLSEGQRLALVVAIQLTAAPRVVLLDEPTRGLDYRAKAALSALLRQLADEGRSVMVSTHDVEFVATCADRVVVMAEGEIVADGPTAEVIAASPAFAPQVAKVLAPQAWLTVEQVRAALDEGDR